jgi:hypothetical protein
VHPQRVHDGFTRETPTKETEMHVPKAHQAELTTINEELIVNGGIKHFDQVSIWREGTEVHTLAVESSVCTSVYDAALAQAGYADCEWI